ncbi:hypothetical protein QZH41_020355 [Actinostola sp. cb2023]|nr:hypothetical protein QZH41_020355 [Actinostola sp. cb2023]
MVGQNITLDVSVVDSSSESSSRFLFMVISDLKQRRLGRKRRRPEVKFHPRGLLRMHKRSSSSQGFCREPEKANLSFWLEQAGQIQNGGRMYIKTSFVIDTYLTTKKSAQLKEEFKASGIEVVETELDILLEEILEKEKEAKLALDDKKKQEQEKEEKDKLSAHDIRKKATERMSQSTKRKDDDEEEEDGSTGVPKKQKTRRSSQELFQFLDEKVSKDYTYKQEKLEAKLKEQEASDKREKERNDRLH